MKNSTASLQRSIARQKIIFDNSLILNPVENIPFADTINQNLSFMYGLYISDKYKSLEYQKNSIIQFGGRSRFGYDIQNIYANWSTLLKSKSMSMRLLSGLHAHIIIFMGIGEIGDKIMLLPESAGGHFATKSILNRLGYEVIDMVVDFTNHCIDVDRTREVIHREQPKIIFVDRSEGLYYEDFTELLENVNAYKIFDASQYITHIIAEDYKHPFDMGFDLVVSTIHKNFPGPQRAIVFTKTDDIYWQFIEKAMSEYVSNQHSFHVYSAGLALLHVDEIKQLSSAMLENSKAIEYNLKQLNIHIHSTLIRRNKTQHSWIMTSNKNEAFRLYKNLEYLRINTNYRKLPYGLGYGIRIGTAAATMQGLVPEKTLELAYIIKSAYKKNQTLDNRHQARKFIQSLKDDAYTL